ncbi:SMC-Scp complex subunit ScpB [Bifidobacterium imperatoris]|uniref:SMC-Scp complex subunit ScpB n=1 Tax=Bifidobacterium imperatoris TaxID=2020965 RepID=A0A2N5IV95_9BIFI|nr:SMC-Scp complex subunit ScpB [Bifidobacterium imperatoris]PLS25868.1 SMC-Scp complex subunit ScpB [Bifidobacterium imperatoris]QSY57656.1 SMC-Scp complex subunit ScpB [Bifidobacterium imperatoris]
MNDESRAVLPEFTVDDFPGGLPACIEAILMVADQPQTAESIARVLTIDAATVEQALQVLQAEYDGSSEVQEAKARPRGFELRHTARGWQFANRAVFEPVVSAFVTDGQTARLSQAALEALAIVAYKQPVTRAQVAAIRGVNSDGVIRSLSIHGLIKESGVDPETRAALLITSELFLERMGLDSLEQLPSLAPFLPSANEMTQLARQTNEVGSSTESTIE